MKFPLFLWFLLASTPALAGGPAKKTVDISACETPESLLRRIASCSDNVLAERAALACHDSLVREWKTANAELATVMSGAQSEINTQQQADFSHSSGDMQLAIGKLAELILVTETAADRLAKYPNVMIDNPYALAGLNGSSECFKSSYRAISKIVNDLDQKSDQGENALAATAKLRGVSQAREQGLTNGGAVMASGHDASEVASRQSKNRPSDITGIEQDKAKQRGASVSGSSAGPDRAPASGEKTWVDSPLPAVQP